MDFRQLEAFIKVVELGSFSKAAEELYVSQPSVSSYITALEKELDTVLINRSTKVLSTTVSGDLFFAKAKEMLTLKRNSLQMLKNLTQEVRGELRILASSVPCQYILPKVLADFHKLYPNITFTMTQGDTAQVVQGIGAHRADIGFAGSVLMNKKCVFESFITEKLVFIAPNNGSYEKNKAYTLEELLYSNHFIARELGSGTRLQYEKFFTEQGIALDQITTCASMDSTQSIINAVQSGLGISIVSELAVAPQLKQKNLLVLNLKSPLPARSIYTVLNQGILHSHLVELFCDYIASHSRHMNLEEVLQ